MNVNEAPETPLRHLAVWLWMTGWQGTRWMRDPNAPRVPLGDRLWAGLGAWALLGLPVIIAFALGIWIIWLFARMIFIGAALALAVGMGVAALVQRMTPSG